MKFCLGSNFAFSSCLALAFAFDFLSFFELLDSLVLIWFRNERPFSVGFANFSSCILGRPRVVLFLFISGWPVSFHQSPHRKLDNFYIL